MNLDGLLVPTVTPFDSKGAIAWEILEAQVEHLIGAGAAGIVACGTTGEYYALSDGERADVLEFVAERLGDRALRIAGINDLSTAGCIRRAETAAAMHYQAVMVSPPAYSLPGQAEIEAHFHDLAEATELGIILYNFPQRTGVDIAVDTVASLARLPNIVGIKESSGDFSRLLPLLELENDHFQLICGCDDQAADYLFWGVRSWISGSGNFLAPEQADMIRAAEAGDWRLVRELMWTMLPVITSMEGADYNQKAKLGCRRHGIEAGPVRPPLRDLSDEQAAAFRELVEALS